MSSSVQRLIRGSGAQFFAMGVRSIEQILLVPVLISAWGVASYGEWILISAIPIYLSLVDFGFVGSASNELARRTGEGITPQAKQFFGRILAVFTLWLGAVTLVVWLLWSVLPITQWLNIRKMPATEAHLAFGLLLAQALLSQQSLVFSAGLRAIRKYHIDITLRAFIALARLVVIFFAVSAIGAGPVAVAAIMLVSGVFLCLAQIWLQSRSELRLVFRWRGVKDDGLGRHVRLGLELMLLPLSQALVLQGTVIVIGNLLGSVAVAIFTTHRTLTRTVLQVVQVAVQPLAAEAGLMQAKDSNAELSRLVLLVSRSTFWLSALITIFLAIIGQSVFSLWTHDGVPFFPALFYLLMMVAVLEGIWRSAASVQLGTNRHQPLVRGYLLISVCGILATVPATYGGLIPVALCIVTIDLMMCFLAIRLNRDVLEFSIPTYMRSLLKPPVREFMVLLRKIGVRSK